MTDDQVLKGPMEPGDKWVEVFKGKVLPVGAVSPPDESRCVESALKTCSSSNIWTHSGSLTDNEDASVAPLKDISSDGQVEDFQLSLDEEVVVDAGR